MSDSARVVRIDRSTKEASAPGRVQLEALPGVARWRDDVPAPAAYAVFDCETTGTDPEVDEIVSLAIVRLDRDGVEAGRYVTLVRPSRSIPEDATAVHGIADGDVADAPRFAAVAHDVIAMLDGAVFVAHNARFDLAMLQRALAKVGVELAPVGVACTLEAFRLLEPREASHRLDSICERRGIVIEDAHDALGDVLATAALLRVILTEGIAPESVRLDHAKYMRLRARGDTRPASEPQIRRVFGMARSAGLLRPDGGVDRDRVVALVHRTTGVTDVDALTREQVQAVYDELERLDRERRPTLRTASA